MDYTHLHVHTDGSPKDGLRPVGSLVTAAKEKGFDALAMTDHGTLTNAVSFSIECELNGIKPITGLEAYVEVDGEIGHMTLLADGNEGFSNLVALNNIGHASSRRQPAFLIDDLIAHNKGIILLSGCVSSPFNKLPYGDALALGARLKGVFGSRFFTEIMFVADTDTWTRPITLSRDLGTKLVITNDAHFPYEQDAAIHPILTSMKAGFTYNSKELWLKRPEDIWARARHLMPEELFKDAIERTHNISSKLRPVVFKRPPSLPFIEDADGKLEALVLKALEDGHYDINYRARAKYELGIIQRMGYSTYFLILLDVVSHAKSSGVRVGPGRGSGAGSLVLFLLGITEIDPLDYALSFERFLNPEREGMPDVDTDFDSEHRDQVLAYAQEKWGAIPIATYARYSHKTLVHDLSKQFHIARETEKTMADKGPECKEFKETCDTEPLFGQAYEAINGQIRHKGKHAGGVIITDLDVPKERAGEGQITASWTEGEHNELSYVGVVKFDLLGLSVLTALAQLEKQFGMRAPEPRDDDPAFSLFRQGDLVGIFQFSGSAGIRDLTMKLQPECFEDLVAINALYRPGALDVGATDKYPEWKKSPREVPELIKDILAPTYGAIVYQEQVMAIYSRLTGGSLGSADSARRVIVKSKEDDPTWVKKFNALRDEFVSGAVRHGMSHKEAEELWRELAAHSRYSFNKAHAVAYARIAWDTAWWKCHHPAHFYAAMLNADSTEAQTYIVDAIEHGIELRTPHVNISSEKYEANDDEIFMPLTSVKYLSSTAARVLLEQRALGEFTSVKNFMERVPRKFVRANAREGLWFLGAFEGLPGVSRDLQIKNDIEDIGKTDREMQQAYLGMVIPTKELLEKINAAHKRGLVAGIVSEMKKKESHWGPYTVYYMTPSGVFWSREEEGINVGDCLAVKVNEKNGKAMKVMGL